MVWGESVSALRLPDAPNIMLNDINFLLNGPRFDSRCEEEAPPALSPGEKEKGTTPGRIICGTRKETWVLRGRGSVEEEAGCLIVRETPIFGRLAWPRLASWKINS